MAGRQVEEEKLVAFARLVGQGVSLSAAAREVGVSYASVQRWVHDPGSRLSVLMADLGSTVVGVPERSRYSADALRALDDFGFFRERFFARASSPWAVEAANRVLELVATPRKEYVVINVAPGLGKSTLFTHDIPAWLAVRDRSISQMIGSATQNMANMYTSRLRNTFERTRPVTADSDLVRLGLAKDAASTLTRDYGRFKPGEGKIWTRREFEIAQVGDAAREGKEASFVAFGMDAGFLGGRFDHVVWDDLVTQETLRTEESRQRLIQLWTDVAETRLEPSGLLVLQGQRLAANDLYRYCLDLLDFTEIDMPPEKAPRKYHHVVFKAHYDEKCTGLHDVTDPAWPEGCLIDPYRAQWRDIMNVKLNHPNTFKTVYQQEDADPATSLVQRIWVDGGTQGGQTFPGCWDDHRPAGIVPKDVTGFSVVTVDPSPTKYWAIQWWLYDPDTEIQTLVDLKREPMDASDFLDWNQATRSFTGLLEEWWQRSNEQGRPFTHLIVEINAAQRYMLQYDHFKRWMILRRVNVVPHSTVRNKSDPAFGVQALGPHYKFGRVRLPGNALDGSRQLVMPMVNEVCSWPNGTTDDTVMSHWFLIWNAPNLFESSQRTIYQFPRPSWAGRGLQTG